MLTYVVIYILLINVYAFYLMYADKKKAIHRQFRIAEKTLWIVAFFGGAVGAAIGMKRFRHKTKHFAFKLGMPFLALIETGIVLYYAVSRL